MSPWFRTSYKYLKQFRQLPLGHGIIRNFLGGSMSKKPNQDSIRIKTANSKDTSNIIRLLRKHFPENEPLVDGLNISRERLSPGMEELWRMSLSQGMSLVALVGNKTKVQNAETLGTAINVNLCSWDSDLLDKLANNINDPNTGDFIRLYAIFIRYSEIFKKFDQEKIFNIFQVIINSKIGSEYKYNALDANDLAKLLLDLSLQAAAKKGFEVACIICTSKRLAVLAEACGMDLIWEYPYAKLVDTNFKPLVQWKSPDSHVKVYAQEF